MDQRSNVNFTRQEIDLMRNDQIFPQKVLITKKITDLFSDLSLQLKDHPVTQTYPFPEGTDITAGKISKGENYQEQPYLILDLPRKFSREVILAYRTMFWWGHCFACTLHIAGNHVQQAMRNFPDRYSRLRNTDTYFCINTNQFEHHFGADNYVPIDQLTEDDIRKHIEEQKFVKIARQLPLSQWDQLISTSLAHYEDFMEVIQAEN